MCFSTIMCYVLVEIPCELEENVYSAVVEISLCSHLYAVDCLTVFTDISAHWICPFLIEWH